MTVALVIASLFLTNPAPLDMPRASAYLVKEAGKLRLEDRYRKDDQWVSRAVDGRWIDEAGRVFVLAHLDVLPPEGGAADEVATRVDYTLGRVAVSRKDKLAVKTAIDALSPVALPEKEERPRQLPRGFKDVDYWQGTNTSAIVCAYLPEKSVVWRLATWELVEGDDFDEALELFEREFLDKEALPLAEAMPIKSIEKRGKEKKAPRPSERELLRADARHTIAAYSQWHATDAEEFEILDDLETRDFISTLTNDLPVLRKRYAEVMPTAIDGSNVLAVARIFADRNEYLNALATAGLTNMTWSAAYWSPTRRELVAHWGATGDELIKTIRHEAFHQYLSYASSMIAVSPWLNEGYAQYFEDEESEEWKLPEGRPSPEALEQLALALPGLMMADYEEFYAGRDVDRRLKYRLAWSIAVFLEKGAPEVRFRPFKTMKKDYFAALFETKDMRLATTAALRNKDLAKKFAAEWLKFWKDR